MNRRVVFWSLLLGAAALTLSFTVQPFRYGDEWWHIALGRLVLAHGIPREEPFSFITPAHPWVEQQWLYEVLLAKLDALGPGVASLFMGVVASVALLVAALAIPREDGCGAGWRAAAIILCGLVAAPVLGVRGEVVSALGLALTLLIVVRWREGRTRAVWWLPPLFLLWANLHAGFVAGLALLGFAVLAPPVSRRPRSAGALLVAALLCALLAIPLGLVAAAALLVLVAWDGRLSDGRRQLLLATAVSVAATLVNPWGPGLYGYIAESFGNPLLGAFVNEWQSPDFHDTFNRLFEVVAALLVLLWAAGGRARRHEMLLAGAAFLAALQAERNVLVFAVIALPQVAVHAAHTRSRRAPSALRRLRAPRAAALTPVAALAVLAATLAVIAPGLSASASAGFEATRQPKAALDYVIAHFPGQRLYAHDDTGGYIAYRIPDSRVVYVYDEIGIFGEGPLNRYLDIHQLHADWRQQLDSLHVSHAVLPASADEAAALLETGWTVDCYDARSASVVMSAGGPPAASPPPPPSSAPAC